MSAQWLDRCPTAEEVRAHAEAHPFHGGHVAAGLWLLRFVDAPAEGPQIVCLYGCGPTAYTVELHGMYGGGRWLPLTAEGLPVPTAPIRGEHEPLSAAEVAEIEARVNAATEGPWAREEDEDGEVLPDGTGYRGELYETLSISRPPTSEDQHWIPVADCIARERSGANADFIAHARTDVPRLIAAVRALQEENARLRAALAGVIDACSDRQAFVMQGPRAFARAEQIALEALKRKA